MNLAILIGVSSYGGKYNDLPGCANDVNAMHQLLQATGKYQSILLLNATTTSQFVKGELSKFIASQKQNPIDEVFFYFSGHGDFVHDDFLYLFTDHDSARLKQTSLSNSELDQQLRALRPKLALKVIDACHSGVSYVKTPDVFQKYLDASRIGFEKCYFMFSSQANQKSYQTAEISDFTRSFLCSLEDSSEMRIRYKDIIDFISDDFERNSYQTPFFVIQADFTELFWEGTTAINLLVKKSLPPSLTQKSPEGKKNALIELVKKDAKDYCTQEEIATILSTVPERIKEILNGTEFKELYDYRVESKEDYKSVPRIETVGVWLDKNKNEYFSRPVVRTEIYEVPDPMSAEMNRMFGMPVKMKEQSRTVVAGFELLVGTPFKVIEISASPLYENLAFFRCNILFTFSKIQIRFFYAVQDFKEIKWGERTVTGEPVWKTVEVKLKDNAGLNTKLKDIIDELHKAIEEPLLKRFSPADSEDKQDGESGTNTRTEKKTKEPQKQIAGSNTDAGRPVA